MFIKCTDYNKIMTGLAILKRFFFSSPVCCGKKNFRKFPLYNKRGTRRFKQMQQISPHPDIPIYTYGVRPIGYQTTNGFVKVPEMIPQLIVPDLSNCELKPYVSYAVEDINEPEFTAKDLFVKVYSKKIVDDFNNDKLTETGDPIEPSEAEKLRPEQAALRSLQTGSDVFS